MNGGAPQIPAAPRGDTVAYVELDETEPTTTRSSWPRPAPRGAPATFSGTVYPGTYTGERDRLQLGYSTTLIPPAPRGGETATLPEWNVWARRLDLKSCGFAGRVTMNGVRSRNRPRLFGRHGGGRRAVGDSVGYR